MSFLFLFWPDATESASGGEIEGGDTRLRRMGGIATVDDRKMRSWVVATPDGRLSQLYTASIFWEQ